MMRDDIFVEDVILTQGVCGCHRSPCFSLGPGFGRARCCFSRFHQAFLNKCDSHLHLSDEKILRGLQHLIFSEDWTVTNVFWLAW